MHGRSRARGYLSGFASGYAVTVSFPPKGRERRPDFDAHLELGREDRNLISNDARVRIYNV